jgi:hypothetical protein
MLTNYLCHCNSIQMVDLAPYGTCFHALAQYMIALLAGAYLYDSSSRNALPSCTHSLTPFRC